MDSHGVKINLTPLTDQHTDRHVVKIRMDGQTDKGLKLILTPRTDWGAYKFVHLRWFSGGVFPGALF